MTRCWRHSTLVRSSFEDCWCDIFYRLDALPVSQRRQSNEGTHRRLRRIQQFRSFQLMTARGTDWHPTGALSTPLVTRDYSVELSRPHVISQRHPSPVRVCVCVCVCVSVCLPVSLSVKAQRPSVDCNTTHYPVRQWLQLRSDRRSTPIPRLYDHSTTFATTVDTAA